MDPMLDSTTPPEGAVMEWRGGYADGPIMRLGGQPDVNDLCNSLATTAREPAAARY